MACRLDDRKTSRWNVVMCARAQGSSSAWPSSKRRPLSLSNWPPSRRLKSPTQQIKLTGSPSTRSWLEIMRADHIMLLVEERFAKCREWCARYGILCHHKDPPYGTGILSQCRSNTHKEGSQNKIDRFMNESGFFADCWTKVKLGKRK